ncbi:dispersed gene family protein 1 (DGF-1) [Trypanosoma conorhini]|uniref:Dispersed gene family protein 1 (DGF-1) n=1 Tax=Trypanosoma conorhini TaxID=83891 RepID=A0A3R7L2P3_9TRYP|nr:dispersed gene family protein 1 (DGF-1) [Trypanosoma conorhini]RNF19838.1 dispersed gene family protein 1 (DGF-1) [Trypanosoma conorhini]
MEYPEVTQAVGSGLSWLCYRNVTFSGGGMSLTVLTGAMTGDVANVTFDGCTWRDGAVLVLAGSADSAVGSLNIAVTGNTFDDALLSPEGAFPPRTNITISGNQFTLTRTVSPPGLTLGSPSCVAMNELWVANHSAVVFSGNTFRPVAAYSSAIYIVDSSLRVSWDSLFAVVRNTFATGGANSVVVRLGGSWASASLEVLNNSAVVVQGNVVSKPLLYFMLFPWSLRVESRSAVVFGGNLMQGATAVFAVASNAYVYYDSWVQVSGNLCRGSPGLAFAFLGGALSLRNSALSVSRNEFRSDTNTPTALRIADMAQRPLKRIDCGRLQHCERRKGGGLHRPVGVQRHDSELQRPMRPRGIVLPRVYDDDFGCRLRLHVRGGRPRRRVPARRRPLER